jgi:hypothetical protein
VSTTNGSTNPLVAASMTGTNTASPQAVEAVVHESVLAMETWIKSGGIPVDYLRRQLGDPSLGVVIAPAPTAPEPPKDD